MDCPICLDNFNVESQILSTPCDHYYHSECIYSWLATGSQSCPIRRKIGLSQYNLRSIYLRFSAQDYESKILHVQIIYEGYEEMPRISFAQDVSSNRGNYFQTSAFQRIILFIRRILDFLCLCECMGQ